MHLPLSLFISFLTVSVVVGQAPHLFPSGDGDNYFFTHVNLTRFETKDMTEKEMCEMLIMIGNSESTKDMTAWWKECPAKACSRSERTEDGLERGLEGNIESRLTETKGTPFFLHSVLLPSRKAISPLFEVSNACQFERWELESRDSVD